MSIDGTETDQQAYPTPITRFWMKLWPNGKMTPQFRPDGSEVLWGEQNSGMIGLKFLPFSTEFAAIVQEKGTFAIPSRLPVVEITLDPSETVNVRRFNARTDGTWYHCQHCNNCFDWPMVPPEPECPQCGARNHWYCDQHGQIDNPVFFKRQESETRTVTEARCPICSEPHGLIRSTDLELVDRPTEHRIKYVVQVPDAKIIFDESTIRVERSCLKTSTTSMP